MINYTRNTVISSRDKRCLDMKRSWTDKKANVIDFANKTKMVTQTTTELATQTTTELATQRPTFITHKMAV